MKVLWFSNTPANAEEYFISDLKGSGGWLRALDQSLQNHVELHIAFYKQYDKSFRYKGTYYHPIITNQGILKRGLNRFKSYITDTQDLPQYLEIINQVKPDIIHIHGTEFPFICILQHTNIPVVVSIQGIITVIFHKYAIGFEKLFLSIPNRKTSGIKDFLFPWSFSVDIALFKKMHIRELKYIGLAKHIIGRTSWDKRVTRILAPDSTYYHGDEILRESFYQYQWAPHFTDTIIIHTTNSNTFYKGFETLCKALNELNKIGIKCEWRVAGIAQEDLIVQVTKKKLRNNYPQKGLVLMGSINETDLVEALLQADMFVMTSHIDNSPNGLCEAMILGIPCISTFVGGTGSLLQDDKDGILIQDGDPWAMAGAILEISNNMEKYVKLGQNARKISLLRHKKDRIVIDLIKVYENILNVE